MEAKLKAEARDGLTKSGVKKLRSGGKVPGVVYGRQLGAVSIAVDAKELLALLRHSPNAILEMELPGSGPQPVMVHDVQRDRINRNLLHIDFHQINMDEPVRTSVALEFQGEAKGEEEGGMLQIQLHEVEVRCLPSQIPVQLIVSVTALELGDTILVRDLSAPAGVEIKSHPDDVVVTILAPQKQELEPEGAGETAKNAKSAPASPEAVSQ